MSETKLYKVWSSMKQRCSNKKSQVYKYYGGKGIKVCEEWDVFMIFHNWAHDNGYKIGLSIDRIDGSKEYSPKNCRWSSKSIQTRNTKKIYSNNTSGYRGVSFRKDRNTFRASINIDSRFIALGCFKNPIDGAIAYDKYITDNNLEHTKNF